MTRTFVYQRFFYVPLCFRSVAVGDGDGGRRVADRQPTRRIDRLSVLPSDAGFKGQRHAGSGQNSQDRGGRVQETSGRRSAGQAEFR